MSTTLLYQVYSIRGYRYRSMKCVPGGIEITIEQPRDRCRCTACGGQNVILKGCKKRRFHAPPMGSKHVTIVLDVPRVECRDCGELRQVDIAFAKPNATPHPRVRAICPRPPAKHDVRGRCPTLGRFVGHDPRHREGTSQRHYDKPRLKDVTQRIAIDEIAVRKGHKYMTVVLDLDTGRVIFVGDGRGGESLSPFWKRLRRSRRSNPSGRDRHVAGLYRGRPSRRCPTRFSCSIDSMSSSYSTTN